jgi:hypothetical protein
MAVRLVDKAAKSSLFPVENEYLMYLDNSLQIEFQHINYLFGS